MTPVQDTNDGHDGVSAHRSAGTPSPFRPAHSEAALQALEFGGILDLVAGHAAGPLGAERIRGRRPSADLAGVRAELGMLEEVRALLVRGGGLDVPAVPALEETLSRLRVAGSVLEGPALVAVRDTLSAARTVAEELQRVAAEAPRAAALRVPLPNPAIERRLGRSVDDSGELLDGASPTLARARREVQEVRERLVKKLEAVLRSVDPSAEAGVTVRNGRYVIPVRRDSRARPDGIVHDESASAGTLFVEPTAAIEMGNALRSALVEAEREALRVLRELTELLRPEALAIAAAHEMCVRADDLLARARYARAVGAAVPEMLPAGAGLTLRQARHPLLLARGLSVVPFDLSLDQSERTLLISGPNAGGKTVLLKTVGIAAALAQSGIAPPLGRGSALPLVTSFAADIGDHQSLAADLSTFSAHVAALRSVLASADRGTLVLVDEIGSGTDPAEGGALAAAVLRALTRQGALTLATTHLGTLKQLATETPGVVNGSLEFDAERLLPTFHFTKGMPGRSYGLAIARRLGIAAQVLADAEGRLSDAERSLDALLEAAEARERALRAEQALLADRLAEAERAEARLARDAEELRARMEELRIREKSEERRARAESRRMLLEARGKVEEALRAAQAASDEHAARETRRLLEAAVKSEGDALRALEEEAESPAAAGALSPGQSVRLAGGGTARVVELRDDGRVVVLAGAARMVVPREGIAGPVAEPAEPVHRAAPRGRTPDASDAPMEIDLRGLRGDEAESVTQAALDAAVLADHPFLRIIHGMGTGVVRETVRRVLSADRRVRKFDFAPRSQGGTGVTVAEFEP